LNPQSRQRKWSPDSFVNIMAPLKRPAASQDVTPRKKHASPVKQDAGPAGLMQVVRDAVSNSSAPPVVKEMLNISMDYSLGIAKKFKA